MINGRHHCLNTALELELGTLPCSTECDARDLEPMSPPRQHPTATAGLCSWGSAKPPPRRLEETGLSSLAEITPRGAEKKLHV